MSEEYFLNVKSKETLNCQNIEIFLINMKSGKDIKATILNEQLKLPTTCTYTIIEVIC